MVKNIADWLRYGAIKIAVNKLVDSKKKNNGRMERNGYSEAFESLKAIGVNVQMDSLYKQVERDYSA